MKKILAVALVMLILGVSVASAVGDKNRGDKGQGKVKQVQVRIKR